MPRHASFNYATLTQETESLIRRYAALAATATQLMRRQLYEDLALGAFSLWAQMASEAALASRSPTAYSDYDTDRLRLEALMHRRGPTVTAEPNNVMH